MTVNRELFPMEKLLLAYLCKGRRFQNGADLTDCSSFFGVWTVGHAKWTSAQLCVTFMTLRGLERAGYVTWKGKSRALGRDGYHYGLWTLTEEGMEAAKDYA